MSYKFSGAAGSHALRSAISQTPFPGAWPLTVAGWVKYSDITTLDCQPFSLEIDTDVNQSRIAISSDATTQTEWDYFIKVATSNDGFSIPFPAGLAVNDWVFHVFVFRSNTDRQGYVVHKGRLIASAVVTASISYLAANRVTFGYLPFFGNLNDHQGLIGSWGIWKRALTEPEIIRMGRGEPLVNFKNGMVDMWSFDGRIVSQTVKSLYRKLDLTVTGPPAWNIGTEPKLSGRRRVWRSPSAAAYTLTADAGTFNLTGNAAALKAARQLAAALGTYALTGNAAGLKRGYPLAAGVGTFALTGNAAGLKADRRLTAAQGSFTLTGNATGLRADRQMPAALGVFALTGNAAGLRRGFPLAAATGTFALTGNVVGLSAARQLQAATAAFVLTGQDAVLTYGASAVLAAGTGVFGFTGNPVGLTVTRNLVAAQGTFALTGNAAGLVAARKLAAAQAAFNLTGNPAILGYTQYGGGSGGGTGSGSGSILSEMGIY